MHAGRHEVVVVEVAVVAEVVVAVACIEETKCALVGSACIRTYIMTFIVHTHTWKDKNS